MHRAGFTTVAACEFDPWRRAVFSHNFPQARMYDDVRTLSASRLISNLGVLPDVIVGSPPCQDASLANTKGKGVDGERTGLFFEAIRLVGECRPRWAAFENVPGLRNRGADRVLGALEALGYAAEAHVVGASDIGANHERKRVWIVAFDPAQVGHGGGRTWRHGPHGDSAAYLKRRFVGVVPNSDEARLPHGQMVPSLRSAEKPDDGCFAGWGDEGAVADADKDQLRAEHGRRGRASGGISTELAHDVGNAKENGRRERRARRCSGPDSGLSVETCGDGADANRDWQPNGAEHAEMGGSAGAGAISQEPWADWNGGLAASLLLDDGLSAGVADSRRIAGAIVAAYGDAVLPQITEAIGRSIWRVETALAAVTEAA
jgi:DNA (cytosine-5)-methyltransferase 1